jgi:hypothetical protein
LIIKKTPYANRRSVKSTVIENYKRLILLCSLAFSSAVTLSMRHKMPTIIFNISIIICIRVFRREEREGY